MSQNTALRAVAEQLVRSAKIPEQAHSPLVNSVVNAVAINWDNIPTELQIPHWVLWHPALKKTAVTALQQGKTPNKIMSKPPLGDPKVGLPFELAKAKTLQYRRQNTLAGIALRFTPDHPYICLDIDDGNSAAAALVEQACSYTEWSPSNNGAHIIIALQSLEDKALLVNHFGSKAAHNSIELYASSNNYVTITGRTLEFKQDHSIRVMTGQAAIALLEPYFVDKIIAFPDAQQAKSKAKSALKSLPLQSLNKLSEAACIRLLQDIHPANLYESVFDDLQAGESAALDPLCEEGARTPWLKIAQALHHNFNGSLSGYKIFLDWSARDPNKFDESACESVWRSFTTNPAAKPVTIAALIALHKAQKPQYPAVDAKGNILPVIHNVLTFFTFYKYRFKFNDMQNDVTVHIPENVVKRYGFDPAHTTSIDAALPIIRSELILQGFPLRGLSNDTIVSPMVQRAMLNPEHKIRDYFNNLQWDGISRLEELYSTIKFMEASTKHPKMFIRKWMIQVAAAVHSTAASPNTLSTLLIFTGKQGIGKSKWAQSLFPPGLREHCEDNRTITFDKYKQTDQEFELSRSIIANIDEVDRLFRPHTVSDLKAFLSTTKTVKRLPYAKTPITLVRRTVFLGSTNEQRFLSDYTGNRRIFVIAAESLDYAHNIDVDQLWAEIVTLYNKGEKWWLDDNIPEEAQAIEYQQIRNASMLYIENQAMEDDLNDIFDTSAPFSKWRMMTFKDITRVLGSDVRTNSYAYRAAKRTLIAWLQSFPQYYIYNEPRHQMRYKMPPVRTRVP